MGDPAPSEPEGGGEVDEDEENSEFASSSFPLFGAC
jgi:hypothetical protein